MGLSFSFRHSIKPSTRFRLSHGLSQAIANRLIELRVNLVSQIAGVIYNPSMNCPACKYHLTMLEVLKGYTNDPLDLRTTCPKCATRFEAKLVSRGVELVLYCPSQALHELRGNEGMSQKDILEWNPSVYHSALIHFGTITNAFKQLGVEYQYLEVTDWHGKVQPFLGNLPDTTIAEVVGVSRKRIASLRKSLGIGPFRRSQVPL